MKQRISFLLEPETIEAIKKRADELYGGNVSLCARLLIEGYLSICKWQENFPCGIGDLERMQKELDNLKRSFIGSIAEENHYADRGITKIIRERKKIL